MKDSGKKAPRMTLKKQLIVSFLLVALVPTLTLSVFLTVNSIESLSASYVDNRSRAISQSSDNLDKQAQWIRAVSDQIFMSPGVADILRRSPDTAGRFDPEFNDTISSVNNQYQYTPVASYVRALIIAGNNGAQIRLGPDASLEDLDAVKDSDWYRESEGIDGVYWGKPVENYSFYSRAKTVIPARVRLADPGTGRSLGSLILLLDPELLSTCYDNLTERSGGGFYVLKRSGEILSSESSSDLPAEFAGEILARLRAESAYSLPATHFETNCQGMPVLVTYQRSGSTGWMAAEILPLKEIRSQILTLLVTVLVLCLAAAVLCLTLSYFLSRRLTRPIDRMVRRVKEIGQGRFDGTVPGGAAVNELGILDESISQMQSDIDGLIRENVDKEREKRTIEMQMLQSQINPHFLYNTLNTIKLMATFQGAAGIERMLVALGRILRFSLGETREKVVLADELGVLEDYLHIQKIRYKGKISFSRETADEKLMTALVPRFILQPIVENSIKHGFAGSEEQGEIAISVSSEGERLLIAVRDNGSGMSPEQLEQLREKLRNPPERTGGESGLGMLNVHSRIRLMYGDDYGLRVESGPDGTCVTVVLKLEYGGNTDENSDR